MAIIETVAVVVEVSVTRADGIHYARQEFELTEVPTTEPMSHEERARLTLTCAYVGSETTMMAAHLASHACKKGEKLPPADRDRWN